MIQEKEEDDMLLVAFYCSASKMYLTYVHLLLLLVPCAYPHINGCLYSSDYVWSAVFECSKCDDYVAHVTPFPYVSSCTSTSV